MVKMYVIIYLLFNSDLDTSHDGKCRVACNNSFHQINWTIFDQLLSLSNITIFFFHNFSHPKMMSANSCVVLLALQN